MSTTETTGASKRVSQSDLARELGVTRQAVSDLVQRGVLQVGADRKLDRDAARAIILERVRPSGKTAASAAAASTAGAPAAAGDAAPATPTHDNTAGYYVAKAQREASEAGIAELRLRQMRGELIERESTVQAVFTSFRQLRNAMQFLPRNVAGRLVGLTSPREIELVLQDAQREVFEQFARKTLPSLAMRLGAQVPVDEVNAP